MPTGTSQHEPTNKESRELTPEMPDRAAQEISLLDVAILLAERKRLILYFFAVCTTIGVALALLLPKRYTATVTLLPPQQSSSVSSALAAQLGNLSGLATIAGGTLGFKPSDLFVGMLRGRTVEDAMIQRFNLMGEYHKHNLEDTRLAFEKHTDVDGAAKDSMIHISVEDRDPRRAAELANGYVDELRKLSQRLAITEASQRRLFFEQQLVQAKDSLADAEEELKRTEQSTGVIELTGQARALIESASSLRAQIAAKEVEIQGMQTYATSQNAGVIQAQQELASLRQQLSKLGGSEESAGGLIVPKGKVPQASLEYIRKLREVKYRETIFEILARQFELAKLDEAKQGAVIQVVDFAIPPDKRSFPKRTLMVIVAAVVGILFGVFAALISAALNYLKSNPNTGPKWFHLKRKLAWNSVESVDRHL